MEVHVYLTKNRYMLRFYMWPPCEGSSNPDLFLGGFISKIKRKKASDDTKKLFYV